MGGGSKDSSLLTLNVKRYTFKITRKNILLQYPASLRKNKYWWGSFFSVQSQLRTVQSNHTGNGPRSIYFLYLYPKVIRKDIMHTYYMDDVYPAEYYAAVACSIEACINLKCITTPVWHQGIFPEFVDL